MKYKQQEGVVYVVGKPVGVGKAWEVLGAYYDERKAKRTMEQHTGSKIVSVGTFQVLPSSLN